MLPLGETVLNNIDLLCIIYTNACESTVIPKLKSSFKNILQKIFFNITKNIIVFELLL